MFNPVAPYGYLLSNHVFVYGRYHTSRLRLFSVVGPGLVSDITRFCEQQHQPSSGSAWPACPKNGKSGPHCWGREGSTQFAQQFLSAVTAPPLVGCVVWSQWSLVSIVYERKWRIQNFLTIYNVGMECVLWTDSD